MRPRATGSLKRKACSNSSNSGQPSLFKNEIIHYNGAVDRLAARAARNHYVDVGQLLQDVLRIDLVVHPLWQVDGIERHPIGVHSVSNLEALLRTNAILQYHPRAPAVEFNGNSWNTGSVKLH